MPADELCARASPMPPLICPPVDQVALDAGRYDAVMQIPGLNHVRISADGIVPGPVNLRAPARAVRPHGPHRRAPAAGTMGRQQYSCASQRFF